MKRKWLVVLLIIGMALFAGSRYVGAQTTPPATIVERESLEAEIAAVRRTYSGQLSEYRQAENQFLISKSQFEQLNTLSSLEVAVQDYRKVLSLRDQVLLTYLKLIELNLLETEGINQEEQEIALERTRALQLDFSAHKDVVDGSFDRTAVNKAADDFTILAPRIEALSSYASTLIQVGKLQNVYDKTDSLVEETDPEVADGEQSVGLNERIRAHDEIQRVMDGVDIGLRGIWDEIRESRVEEDRLDISRENASVFAGLSQALSYLEEIVR